MSAHSDQPPRGKMPLPGWIVGLAWFFVAVALALLVYAISSESVVVGVLAVISLLFFAGFLHKFQRRR